MGFMTEVGILNDCFDQIEKDPQRFVADIKRGMNRSRHYDPRPYYIGQTTIHPSHHADDPRVYLAERNGFYNLSEYGIEDLMHDSTPSPHHLDFYEDEIDKAISMLKSAKKYVRYLRSEVGFDDWPGNHNDFATLQRHHSEAWRWKEKK